MKYSIGDLVLLKRCEYKPRPPWKRRHELPQSDLYNTLGKITKVEKYSDIFVNPLRRENDDGYDWCRDNGYFWCSQVDGVEYYMYEDEFNGEIIK